MTKRRTNSGGRRKSGEGRSLLGGIIGLLVLVLALVLSRLTGIDFLQILTGTALPTTPVAVTAPPAGGTQVASNPGSVTALSVPGGFGAQKAFWQVFFTAPTGSGDVSTYRAGIDTQLAAALNSAQRSIDMAAYEFNNAILTQAMLDADRRGVRVRVVTDDEDGIGDEDSTLEQLVEAGIPVVADTRRALMHNKFVIIDSSVVWTGSWNYTINDTYRNNNNALVLRSRRAVENFQAEFDEMFARQQFGPRSPTTANTAFNQDGVLVQTYFGPEDQIILNLDNVVGGAQESLRFMTFSFTLDTLTEIVADRAAEGVEVQGIFETVGSETQFSALTPLFCAGLNVRQDGNRYILHHKVFIIDETTVVTGSFNFSANATNQNDENLMIIQDPDLAAQYLAEFDRRWAEATAPEGLNCS